MLRNRPDPSGGRRLRVLSGAHRLDARLHESAGVSRGALLVTHPHPAHGGHSGHPVVLALATRGVAAGLTALRLDFRGVRGSEGSVEDAEGHAEDVRQGAHEVRRRAPHGPLLGAGYSYGARALAASVAPGAEDPPGFGGLLLLAPATRVPRTRRDFGNLLVGRAVVDADLDPAVLETLSSIPVPACVLVGERDVVAPPSDLEAALPRHAVLTVLPGLNHFFSLSVGAGPTALEILEPAIDEAFEALLTPARPPGG